MSFVFGLFFLQILSGKYCTAKTRGFYRQIAETTPSEVYKLSMSI
jgi:hypothetical protein